MSLVVWQVNKCVTFDTSIEDEKVHSGSLLHGPVAFFQTANHTASGRALNIFFKRREKVRDGGFRAFCSPLKLANAIAKLFPCAGKNCIAFVLLNTQT